MNASVDTADLDGCSREPIHIPGAIQPHGALLVLTEPDLRCVQGSANCGDFLGRSLAELLEQPLGLTLPEVAAAISEVLAAAGSTLKSPISVEVGGRELDISLRRTEASLLAEFEEAGPDASYFHRELQQALAEMRGAESLEAQYDVAVRFVGALTGFARVLMYRFDADWHGQVVAECLSAPVDSYLGLHFPASDIPAQARELYRKSWLRIIPNSTYVPVPVEPAANPITGRPLDMSAASLRSVSPVHLEYLRNMGVAASMSISLVVDGRLWGLIACHHESPRVLPFAIRVICEIFGQVASFEIRARQEARQLSQFVHAQKIQSEFFDVISEERDVLDALVKYTPQLLDFMDATGAAVHVNGGTTLLGGSPSGEEVDALIEWLKGQDLNPLFATNALSSVYPEAEAFRDVASGVLAVRLSRVEPHFVMWFRPEVVTTVTWAGPPEEKFADQQRLSPRKSFAAWQQTVTGQARPWGEAELRGARELMLAINALVLRRTETLVSQNAELERQNTDLNSFAYIASHDLREPLRGLENYLLFLKEDHAAELSTEAIRKVETMQGLVGQTKELIKVLNHYSHIGRLEVAPRLVNLDTSLDQVMTVLSARIREVGAKIRRPSKLPSLNCDPVLIREVFSNLLTNALKYNAHEDKLIEIGGEETADRKVRLFVRDNGIGIKEQHFTDIFRMFRRLHPQGAYGGGTGAGLAIVKTIVERHGGRVWLESTVGEGTTFWFELPK